MRLPRPLFAALVSCAVLAAGCANQPPAPLGGIVGLTMAQQILDPQAGVNRPSANGIDGQAAKSAYDSYQKSFRAPQPQPKVFTIGVGGAR
jgi:hypothetical protein